VLKNHTVGVLIRVEMIVFYRVHCSCISKDSNIIAVAIMKDSITIGLVISSFLRTPSAYSNHLLGSVNLQYLGSIVFMVLLYDV
jgi:hypothetical protein